MNGLKSMTLQDAKARKFENLDNDELMNEIEDLNFLKTKLYPGLWSAFGERSRYRHSMNGVAGNVGKQMPADYYADNQRRKPSNFQIIKTSR